MPTLKRRRLTHRLSSDHVLRAATFGTWLWKHSDLSREKAMEVAIELSRLGKLTADGKLRKGVRLNLK